MKEDINNVEMDWASVFAILIFVVILGVMITIEKLVGKE